MKKKYQEENAEMQTDFQKDFGGEYSKAIPQPAIDRLARFMLAKLQEVSASKNQAA